MSWPINKPPHTWDESDILDLIQNQTKESISLDYKSGGALPAKTDPKRDEKLTEISKDVSAFANSEGGMIIYGVTENGQVPTGIDGVDSTVFSKETLEQVINSRIHSRLDGVRIYPIDLPTQAPGRVVYVVDIPQAIARAPHQAYDKRYYKRFNFTSVAMEDYEVKDVMRRAGSPDLYCEVALTMAGKNQLIFQDGQPESDPLELHVSIGNNAIEPSNHSIVELYIDERVKIIDSAGSDYDETIRAFISSKGVDYRARKFSRNFGIISHLPVFKGKQFRVFDRSMRIAIPVDFSGQRETFIIMTVIYAPHMVEKKRAWGLELSRNAVTLNDLE